MCRNSGNIDGEVIAEGECIWLSSLRRRSAMRCWSSWRKWLKAALVESSLEDNFYTAKLAEQVVCGALWGDGGVHDNLPRWTLDMQENLWKRSKINLFKKFPPLLRVREENIIEVRKRRSREEWECLCMETTRWLLPSHGIQDCI